MSFVDCIKAAAASGKIREEKAGEAIAEYDRTRAEMLAKGMDENEAAYAASVEATKRVTTAKGDARWRRVKEMQAAYRIGKAFETGAMKPWEIPAAILEGDDRLPFANVETRHQRIRGQFHAMMEAGLEKYRPRAAGMWHPKAGLDDLVREVFEPGSTRDRSAAEIAEQWGEVSDHARKRANRAGTSIHKMDRPYLPQQQDRMLLRGKKAEWMANHMAWLDWDNMTHFNDGRPIAPEEREAVLSSVYDTLLTDGYVKIRPGVRMSENMAARLSHQRFLIYKDAESWLAANRAYGSGDAFQQMVKSMDTMSRDIAMMEVLGPNPAAMKVYLENTVRKSAADMDVAKQGGGVRTSIAKADAELARFDEMYAVLTNAASTGEEDFIGNTFAGVRNVLSSAMLGTATLAAIPGDLMTMHHVRFFDRLSGTHMLRSYLKQMNPLSSADRRLAVRSGLIAESSSSIALGHTRYFGAMTGPQLSRRISDTVMRASLMSPHTQAAKWAFGMEFMGLFADHAGQPFEKLPFRATLERHGITAKDWDIFRATDPYKHGGASFIRPDDVLGRTDLDEGTANGVADKFMDMILDERKFAVPESSLRGRASLVGTTRGGTFLGEVVRSYAMFKNFPVTIMLTHARRGLQQATLGGKAKYLGSFFLGLTAAGALSTQAYEIAAGRDPMDMTSPQFWGKAALRGGGLGYLGDFLFAELNRYGSGLDDMVAGPMISFMSDLRNLTVGNLMELAEGKDTKFAKELLSFGARYAPGSTLWYAKLALRRLILDQLMQEADPAAARRFRQEVVRSRKVYGQDYWWRPGQTAPDRSPAFGGVIGG